MGGDKHGTAAAFELSAFRQLSARAPLGRRGVFRFRRSATAASSSDVPRGRAGPTRLQARRLGIGPDPLRIAQAFVEAGLEDVALLHAAEPGGWGMTLTGGATRSISYVAAAPDGRSAALDPAGDDEIPRAVGPLADAPRWIGVLPYEAFRALERRAAEEERPPPLCARTTWRRYPAVVRVDHACGEAWAVGYDLGAVGRLARLGGPRAPLRRADLSVREREPEDAHRARVRRAVELILAGDLYQVNLARRTAVALVGGDGLGLYARMIRAAPAAFGAYLELAAGIRVLSTSPELLLRAEPLAPSGVPRFGRLATEPIKGTRPRGRDAAHDAALARALDADAKERAELAMIIDVERHDLGRVARVGSVRIARAPRVVTHRTLHHRKALLRAEARPDATRAEVLKSMLPSGSVTGAPKIRAMEVIAALEAHRRGLYTGGIGFVAHDGAVTLAMAIRTLVLSGDEGHYFAGGGIVADSDPERELRETEWKSRQLLAATESAP
jgi:anthranilate/para-aminobenzoate synthase component I